MASGNVRAGRYTVCLLVIKKNICLVRPQEVGFVQSTQENGLVNTDIPGA
jgi:hypothetical protein